MGGRLPGLSPVRILCLQSTLTTSLQVIAPFYRLHGPDNGSSWSRVLLTMGADVQDPALDHKKRLSCQPQSLPTVPTSFHAIEFVSKQIPWANRLFGVGSEIEWG